MTLSVLNFYVARMFAVRSLALGLGLCVLIQSLDVIGHSNEILAVPGATESALWLYAKLRFPSLMSQFLPFSILLAALLTLGTLSHSKQIVIMKGAGYSTHQILAPLISVAALIACFHFWFNEAVVVAVQQDLESWQATGYGARPSQAENVRDNVWVEQGSSIVFAGRATRDNNNAALENVIALDINRDGELQTITLAGAGVIQPTQAELRDVRTINPLTKVVLAAPAKPWQTDVSARLVFRETLKPEYLTISALWQQLRSMDSVARIDPAYATAFQRKFTWPLSLMLMPLLAAIAGFTRGRAGSEIRSAAIGLAVGFAFLVTEGTLSVLGNSGALPALFAAWGPMTLFGAISTYALIGVEY